MFGRLREKWAVSGWQLLLILCTFAIGGSLSGWAARKLLSLTALEHGAAWVALYIVFITVLWPLSVLLISIPFGQLGFFRRYLARLGRKMAGRNAAPPNPPAKKKEPATANRSNSESRISNSELY